MTSIGHEEPPTARPAWELHDVPATFDVAETARRAGRAVWVEQLMFEVLGRWVAVTPEPHVKQRFAVECHRHAWHAELWRERLPELEETPPDHMTAHPGAAMAEFADALDADGLDTLERLVGVARVLLPHCISAYSHQLHNTSRVTDAPTARVLDLVVADEIEDWRLGELLMQSVLTTPELVRRAADHQARLESLLVAAGGVMGSGTTGGST